MCQLWSNCESLGITRFLTIILKDYLIIVGKSERSLTPLASLTSVTGSAVLSYSADQLSCNHTTLAAKAKQSKE